MEEVVFKALIEDVKFSKTEDFIQNIIETNAIEEVTYEAVKEAVLKLILYKFIKIDNSSSKDCIIREFNFYQACELGSVNSWLSQKRRYRRVA